ncbi:hypothetical protein AYO22_06053 [Fonsecaea multimorphosa]|nr:hypothetical protein AYO22_06053 [Fonsecaea multimorphosa]
MPEVNTTYVVGSNTKAFTAALLGNHVDEGKLKWDIAGARHPAFVSAELEFSLVIRLSPRVVDSGIDARRHPLDTRGLWRCPGVAQGLLVSPPPSQPRTA